MKCVNNDNGRCNLFSSEWVDATCKDGEDCPYRKPYTNGDRLRAMSDEELAKWLHDSHFISHGIGLSNDWWLDWLRQEARDERS